MDLIKLISDIEQVDADASERLSFYTRRKLFRLGSRVAAAAIPTIVAGSLNEVLAQSSAAVEVAKYALTLEYLEDDFYQKGLAASGLIPSSDRTIFSQISKHETAHVALLQGALGASAQTKPTFKYPTGTFTSYQTFVATARILEDTGVAAYKGQAGALINDKNLLQVALQIHSVEARHASEIRRLAGLKGWVSDSVSTNSSLTQGGVNLKTLPNTTGISDDNLRAAFDEPLTSTQVLAIAAPFL